MLCFMQKLDEFINFFHKTRFVIWLNADESIIGKSLPQYHLFFKFWHECFLMYHKNSHQQWIKKVKKKNFTEYHIQKRNKHS